LPKIQIQKKTSNQDNIIFECFQLFVGRSNEEIIDLKQVK
jgi:hypothetical protein